VQLARDLDIATVAEMIECEQQASCVFALSVEYGQGYLYGRPEAQFRQLAVGDFPSAPAVPAALA